MTQENTKRVEIDVLALLHKLWTKKVFILFTAFYVAVFAFLGTYFLIQPTYTSSTRIYVVNQANDGKNLSAQDLQAGTFLTKDYKEIITSNDVLSEVIKDEKLNMTEAELAKMISVKYFLLILVLSQFLLMLKLVKMRKHLPIRFVKLLQKKSRT